MSTFEFKANDPQHGHIICRIEADNEREARSHLKTMIFCRKLSEREIIEVSQRGLGIIDAKTGCVIGSDEDATEASYLAKDVEDAAEERAFAAAGVSPE